MKTVIPSSDVTTESWAQDFTPSMHCRQHFMYLQCMGAFYASPSYQVRRTESLNSYLVLFTTEGSGIIEYQNETKLLPANSMVCIDCRLQHTYYCAPDSSWSFQWMHFNGNCIAGYLTEITQTFHIIQSEDCKQDFLSIFELAGNSSSKSELVCSSALINFCMNLLHSLKHDLNPDDTILSPVVQKAITLFEENFQSRISLEEICLDLSISKYYFSRLFKEQIGFPPHEYIIRLRLNFAKSLLRHSEQSVLQISDSCGFENDSYFISVFKKHEGITPLKYRKSFSNYADT